MLSTAADAALFTARGDVLDRLARAATQGLNVLLSGPPGAGRTSALHQLSRRLRIDAAAHPRFVNAAGVRTPERLLAEVAGDLLPTVRVVGGTSAYNRFSRYADLPAGLVALVDDLPASVAHDVFGRLRDEIWSVPVAWVVTCSERDRLSFLRPPADAFYDVVVDLEPLSDAEAEELVGRRVSATELTVSGLHSAVAAAAGNPRDLIRAVRSIVLTGDSGGAVRERAARRERLRQRLSRPAAMLLEDLDSLGPSSASDQELQARTGWTRSRLVQVFAELEGAGAVESDDVGNGGAGRPRKVYRPVEERPG